MSAATSQPVPALPSATALLLRENSPAPEVLMVQRHHKTAFGNRYAFPGGLLDRQDQSMHAHCAGLSAAEADTVLSTEDGLAYYSAVARELCEEVGIVLARDPGGSWGGVADTERAALHAGELDWATLLEQKGLRIACDALHYVGHWETPLSMPKRFSARFFVAVLPPGQVAVHDGNELTDSRWMSASEALQSARDGELKLPFPTTRTLESIADKTCVEEILAWAGQELRAGIRHKRPEMVDGELRVVVLDKDRGNHP